MWTVVYFFPYNPSSFCGLSLIFLRPRFIPIIWPTIIQAQELRDATLLWPDECLRILVFLSLSWKKKTKKHSASSFQKWFLPRPWNSFQRAKGQKSTGVSIQVIQVSYFFCLRLRLSGVIQSPSKDPFSSPKTNPSSVYGAFLSAPTLHRKLRKMDFSRYSK